MYIFNYRTTRGLISFFHWDGIIYRVFLPTENISKEYLKKYPEKNLKNLKEKLDNYFRGKKEEFDFPVYTEDLSPFIREVLIKTREIPWGHLSSYKELSLKLKGDIKSARAVGQALKRNPLPLIIPCHRVLKGDGGLGGFSGGVEFKKWLLKIEGWQKEIGG